MQEMETKFGDLWRDLHHSLALINEQITTMQNEHHRNDQALARNPPPNHRNPQIFNNRSLGLRGYESNSDEVTNHPQRSRITHPEFELGLNVNSLRIE